MESYCLGKEMDLGRTGGDGWLFLEVVLLDCADRQFMA